MNAFFTRFRENQFVPAALVLGAAFLIVGVIAAWAALAIKNANNALTVTGSATADVAADSARWTVSATRSTTEGGIPAATAQVIADAKVVASYFENQGLASTTIGAVHADQDYSYSQDPNAPKHYIVRQDVSVYSDNPALVQKLSQDISALTNQGLVLQVQDPQYLISTLPSYRISLAGAAVADAKARAGQIVKGTGQSVGRLKSASTASVQVLAKGSMDVSDYGTYDTSTIDKTVMVTVRATFGIN
ncbi:MAG: SIMPL domain-containing protein [Patescibacteria group bacterium]|nr:SIMPL domain-containing protein [Patescibacteria group bacterium]MDE1944379.1 SIMPL domain-containing protein [Patescibacteria group bacterium]MDE1944996.1 SIMPL domain-containing protein [Patescibacteria group bacterium]MDE2057476.1 SIMPL domain-containing protein [Patescibacteria group bacterium]